MKSVHLSVRRIGNSQGIVIPKPILAQLGLNEETEAEISIEGSALVLRKLDRQVRRGWAEAAKKIARMGDDSLVMREFANFEDAESGAPATIS